MISPVGSPSRVPLSVCMRRLWFVWGFGAGFFLLLFFVQFAGDKYGPRTATAAMWLGSMLLPAIGLLAGQFGYSKKHPSEADTVDRSLLAASVWLSVGHFALMVLVIFMQPTSGASPITFLERMQPFLVITQALVTTAMGALFVSQRSEGLGREEYARGNRQVRVRLANILAAVWDCRIPRNTAIDGLRSEFHARAEASAHAAVRRESS